MSLTSHQSEALRRIVKWHTRTQRPVGVSGPGAADLIHDLTDKGYVTATLVRDPRVGEIWHTEPVSARPTAVAR